MPAAATSEQRQQQEHVALRVPGLRGLIFLSYLKYMGGNLAAGPAVSGSKEGSFALGICDKRGKVHSR